MVIFEQKPSRIGRLGHGRGKSWTCNALLLLAISGGLAFAILAHAQNIGFDDGTTAPAITPIEITPQTLSNPAIGVPYSQTFTVVTDEGGPFYWTVDGISQNGLSLNTSPIGSSIELSGIPQTADPSTFTISVTNRNIAATQTYFLAASAETSVSQPIALAATPQASSDIQAQINTIEAEIQQLQNEMNSDANLL